MEFRQRIVLITGGGRGIGLAIGRQFRKEGAVLHLLDRNFPSDFDLKDDPNVFTYTGDVSSVADVKSFVSKVVKASGRVDILVNNAGIFRDHAIWNMSEEDFDAVISVNLKGPWLLCREVAPIMRKQQWGRIINITSRAWLGNFGQSNYGASKGGLVSLTRVLALELAASHVTVNAVAPGLIDTPLTRSLPENAWKKLVAAQPGKEAGTPKDVAAAVLFLASREAGFISGQVLYVDGGKHIGSDLG